METTVKILSGISDEEKGAYLSAIASLATADTKASDSEMEHLSHLCEAAELSGEQQQLVMQAASQTNDQDLVRSLDILKKSDLKYSLLTDLFAFAKSDGNYSEVEEKSVEKIATYLGIDQTQFGLLDQLAEKTNAVGLSSGGAEQTDFLSGLGDKLKQSGINGGGLLKGLVSIAAPIIISRMMNKNRTGSGNIGSGGLLGGGGLGSLIGMLSGGKGMGAAGGLLGRIFG